MNETSHSSMGKNLVIYHSGDSLVNYIKSYRVTEGNFKLAIQLLMETSLARIEIYTPDKHEPEVMHFNHQGTQTIKILSGFHLCDASFDAIYHLSDIAAVSGDNTFERCVSMNVLPQVIYKP